MKALITLIFSSILYAGVAQTKVEEDSTRVHKVILSSSQGVLKKISHEQIKYNYCEVDSLGNYTVLGNIDSKGIPNGLWKFYLGDVTKNGTTDWSTGRVKNGKLEGEWHFSWICIRYFESGIDLNPNPCPNI